MSNIIEVTNDGKIIEVLAGGVITVNGGGGGGGATNLAYTASPTNGIVTSDTGTDATIPLVSTDAGLMSPSDKTKLDGVATGATANATDAQLRDRATHTGTQAISTVSGLQTALDGKQPTGDYATNTALTDGLATKANVSHTHVIADVTNLQTTLDGKAPLVHTHVIADVTGLQTALNGKEPTITAGTSAQYYRGDKTFQTLDKTSVGLANVDNTSDLNKPISTATQSALNAKQDTLVSGTNIKTINSQPITGSGNLTVNGTTNLSTTASATNVIVNSSTGTGATIALADTTNAGLFSPSEKTKLSGIATGATANSTDAQLRDRSTHTGTQLASTISDFASTVLATLLTGLSTATNTAILATDSILIALGKLQAQITSLGTSKENTITAGTTSQYFRGDKTFQTLDKTAVGLSNVDNTSDVNKPISTATQTALNAKQNTITTGTISQYFRGDLSLATLDKTAVGLSNVDNTSDANKPISTATQTALNAKENTLNADQKRKVIISTATPTGGVDGDVWLQYTP